MGTELQQSSVIFHTVNIKKNYSFGEDIIAYFTFNNYQPSGDDFVGVFDTTADASRHEPFVSKKISSLLSEDLPTTVALKIDFILDGGAFELRYIGKEKQVLGKTAPFSISESIDVQESLIELYEGMWSDSSLVLIDKIDPACEAGEDPKRRDDSVDAIINDLVPNADQFQCDAADSTVESTNVIDKSSDKAISCKLIEVEQRKRVLAENALKVLVETLHRQMGFIDRQAHELNNITVRFGRHEALNEDLREENLAIQDENETLHDGFNEIKEEYHDYQIDLCKMKRQMRQDNELIHQLKIQILEDRQEHQDEMSELRDQSIEQIELLERNTIRLEYALNKERSEFKTLLHKNESQTVLIDSTTQKEVDVSDSSTQKKIDVTDSGTQKPIAFSDSTTQTQLSEYTVKIQRLEEKLKEQEKTHEDIIDRLEKELKEGNETKTTVSREYEKTIRDLESRVVNESTIASQKQNDLAVAENRFKEASNDIQFFRQKFIETEQKLQVNQLQLSRAMEELNLVRHTATSTNNKIGDTNDGMVSYSDADDVKSINCGKSSSVSASTSYENMGIDRRRQTGGETTDYTEDEASSWYHQSATRSQSQDSIPPPSYHNHGNNQTDYQYFPAGLIPIKKTTDPDSNEQQIQVVDTRQPARRQRRKYGKPIDLTPTSSLTTVAIPDRGVNQQPFSTMRPNFNKNVAEVDRVTLEKQYAAIRQHRNSLIRETTFLKNKVHGLKQDLLFTQKNMQNFSLEAEHKIAMLLMALNNQEYVSTQDLNAILQMFPVPNNQQVIYPQTCLPQSQLHQPPPLAEHSNKPPNNKIPKNKNGFLSPYAPEYRPNGNNNAMNYQNFTPGSNSPLYIQNDTMQQQLMDYNQQISADQSVDDANDSYIMNVPSQFPETPLPQEPVDASNQLAAIGVPISKTL